MSSDDGNLFIGCVVGFGAGIYWFFKGFKIYREYRVLADTPEMPIRSIPMGLVEIHGKAKGDQFAASPVTKTSCFFYKVDVEVWKTDSKGRGSWSHYKTDCDGVKFYLEDGSGKVLVDAHGAELDLIETAKRETWGGSGKSWRTLFSSTTSPAPAAAASVTDAELVSYIQHLASGGGSSLVATLGQLALSGSVSLGGSSSGRYRLTEYLVLPEHWYDVTGSCVENPKPQDEHDRNLIVKGQNEPTFLISWRSEKEIERTLRNRAAKYIFGGAALAIVCLAIILGKLGMF